jgi:alpha-beta hydrolase superfamily lysophospholipase
MSGSPVVFDCAAGPCLGWFHRAAAPARDTVVVMLAPLGYEALCSYRSYRQLAENFATAGFDVMRFDYHGCGDSAGDDAEPARVEAWRASAARAIDEARRWSGAKRVALFGLRFGALLAMQAAADLGGVDTLVLWAPCASARAFIREMRMAEMARAMPSTTDAIEALGMLFTGETLAAMAEMDARPLAAAPALRALLIGRDDMPGEGPWAGRLRATGCDVTVTAWPGYAGMMAEPHEAVLAPETLVSITDWLCNHHQAGPAASAAPAAMPAQAQLACGTVLETPVTFGKDGQLFGVLSEPQAGARGARADTAVLLLTVGGNYRIGPNRNYVKAAREFAGAGYRALRLDVAGVGDSPGQGCKAAEGMYRDWATVEVSAAIDMLAARGCRRFFLMGICSGSYLAFQTALKDSRVASVVLINSRLLEWDSQRNGAWQTSMQRYYKSTRYYRQALLRADVYGRLVRGQVDVRGIASRMMELFVARAVRAWERLVLRRAPSEGVLAKFRHLARSGVETLVVMSEQDDGLDYVQFHLGVEGSRMRGQRGFRMVLVPDADHTFSTAASQRALFDVLRAFLERRHEPAQAQGGVPARVATT